MLESFETRQQALEAAANYAETEGYIDFDGQNCNDYLDEDQMECGGWDGVDRRCDCGNRRVSWSTTQNNDGKWSVYAEAY